MPIDCAILVLFGVLVGAGLVKSLPESWGGTPPPPPTDQPPEEE